MKFIYTAVVSFLAFLFSMAIPAPLSAHTYSGIGSIVITGDSLAAGHGATDPKVTPQGCLSTLPHHGVYNYSVKGQTSEKILLQNNKVLARRPALIFVSSGGNDVLNNVVNPGSYPSEKTFAEMNQMLAELIRSGALVVYLGIDPQIKNAERLPVLAQLAAKKGALVVDGMKGFWGNSKYMSDRIHPNNTGYKIMCERILKAIKGHYP